MPTDPDRETLRALGARIASFRHAAKLTQETLAESAEISASFVGHLEVGSRQATIGVIRRIAAALGVPLWRLFTDDDAAGASEGGPSLPRQMATAVNGLSADDLQVLIALARRLRGNRAVKRRSRKAV